MGALDCIVGTIDPFVPSLEKPWNKQRAKHLFNRLGFGASPQQITDALSKTPEEVVDELIDSSVSEAPMDTPYWSQWNSVDFDSQELEQYIAYQELTSTWMRRMIEDSPRNHIAFFWSNHFVTEYRVTNCMNYLWEYYSLLDQFALGNFKDFVLEIGKSSMMLDYLNGNQNVKDNPNENYARELYELFTLGHDNGYDQMTIINAARALTGYQAIWWECQPAYFDSNLHDEGDKTIFGQTGNWNFEDAHNMVFDFRESEVSHYICEKICKYFVYDEVDPAIVDALAQTFVENDYELTPVFRQLFKSEYFFEETFIGAKIKSPAHCLLGILRNSGFSDTDFTNDGLNWMFYMLNNLNQEIFSPIDVAGWPGQRDWINENTLSRRWSYSNSVMYGITSGPAKDKFIDIAKELSENSGDVTVIVPAIVDHYLSVPITDNAMLVAIEVFKGDIPSNYFEDGTWDLDWPAVPWQFLNLLDHLAKLPEFQLS